MSPGKLGAQVAHAAVEAYLISNSKLVEAWRSGKHYTKLVMLAEDEYHLDTIERYLNDRGFDTALIIDEGRTEIRAHSKTALGVEIVDKEVQHVLDTFSTFQVYKELPPEEPTLSTRLIAAPVEMLNRKGRRERAWLLGHKD